MNKDDIKQRSIMGLRFFVGRATSSIAESLGAINLGIEP